MEIDEFEKKVTEIYEKFPEEIKKEINGIEIQETPPIGIKELLFGFYIPLTKTIVLCYWGFRISGIFTLEHIENVILHEIQHRIEGKNGKLANQEQKNTRKISITIKDPNIHCFLITTTNNSITKEKIKKWLPSNIDWKIMKENSLIE